MPEQRDSVSSVVDVRRAYETEGVYSARTICRKMHDGARDYIDELLADKLGMVRANIRPGTVVDLCCATGQHISELADSVEDGIGIDFSAPYIASAISERGDMRHVRFLVGDATAMPLKDRSVSTLFCFSALYAIPDVGDVISDISRVLTAGGRAILDFGNSNSLNSYCVRNYYKEWPRTYPISVNRMMSLVKENGFEVLDHRAFQILPLWAGRPAWLAPLLHPFWKAIMKRRIGGRMIDEWISSAPVLRQVAFRHILVVERKN